MLPILRNNLRSLRARDPFESWNHLFEDFLNDSISQTGIVGGIDIYEDDKNVFVKAELPGFNKDRINLTLEDGLLHLEAERSEEKENKDAHYYLRERSLGKWSRSIRLPAAVNQETVGATFKDGVLKISLEKKDQNKVQKIEIKN